MRAVANAITLFMLAAGCEANSPPRVVHDTVWVHDTVRVPQKSVVMTRPKPSEESSVMERCLRAAHVQTASSDELTGAPSAIQDQAREANLVSICTSMPGIYLPELR